MKSDNRILFIDEINNVESLLSRSVNYAEEPKFKCMNQQDKRVANMEYGRCRIPSRSRLRFQPFIFKGGVNPIKKTDVHVYDRRDFTVAWESLIPETNGE